MKNKPDFILWSQNLSDKCIEKYPDCKTGVLEVIFEEMKQTILSKLGNNHTVIICHATGKFECDQVIWNLLANQDEQLINSILFNNFLYGALVTRPVNKKEDRYVLILVKRN
jgi:hypothetical protein